MLKQNSIAFEVDAEAAALGLRGGRFRVEETRVKGGKVRNHVGRHHIGCTL